MELLVVDVEFAHFRLHTFANLGLEGLGFFFLFDRVTHLHYAGVFDEFGELEGRFLHAAFGGEVFALQRPMVGDGDAVTVGFKVNEEAGVLGGGVGPFNGFRAFDKGL